MYDWRSDFGILEEALLGKKYIEIEIKVVKRERSRRR